MEDKQLTPQESMELIASMIQATRRRVATPDLRIALMWSLLVIITTVAACTCVMFTQNPWFNLIWLAIPCIGIPTHLALIRKKKGETQTKSYIDKINDNIWKLVGWLGCAISVVCLAFNICGYPQAWLAMFLYGFIIVGVGAAAQGIVIGERSYIAGGCLSIVSGFVVTIAVIAGISVGIWAIALYLLCLVMMLLVPVIVIRRKINR